MIMRKDARHVLDLQCAHRLLFIWARQCPVLQAELAQLNLQLHFNDKEWVSGRVLLVCWLLQWEQSDAACCKSLIDTWPALGPFADCSLEMVAEIVMTHVMLPPAHIMDC